MKIKYHFANIERVLLILIILLNLFVAFEAVLRPVQAWDGWDNWLLRPKVFYMQNDLSLDYVRYTHDDYPLIMPLMDTYGYIMIGGIDDKNILFFHYMFYLALGGLFFAASQKLFGTKLALLYTLLLLSTQNLIRHGGRFEAGQSDLALGYYIFAGSILLGYFIATRNRSILLLLSIFLGITAQIKNDGMAYFVIINAIVLAVSIYWKQMKYILFLIPGIIIVGGWTLYKILNDYPANFLFRNGLDIHFDKAFLILGAMLKEMINFQNWSLLWIVFVVCVLINWKNVGKAKLLLLILILQWLSYFAIFMITPREPVGHVQNVIDKLYLHLAPLALFISVIIVQRNNTKMNKQHIHPSKKQFKKAFDLEYLRNSLAVTKDYTKLKTLYTTKHPEIKDTNTSKFWNEKLSLRDPLSAQIGMTKDRAYITASLVPLYVKNILDIGIGHGWVEELLQKRNIKLYGCDISDETIRNIKKEFKGNFSVQSIYKLKYKPTSFDAVLLLEVLEHIPPSKTFKILKDIGKLIKPKGLFIVSVPTNEGLESMPDNPSGHVRLYTIPLIRAELELSGFTIKEVKTLYAFNKFYSLKKLLSKIFPNYWKPNNIIILSEKN